MAGRGFREDGELIGLLKKNLNWWAVPTLPDWSYALKNLSILFVLLISIMFTNHDAEGSECDNANTTKEMLDCLQIELRTKADELTKIQKHIDKNLTQEQRTALKKADSTWQSYRDANCASAAALFKGGSIEPLVLQGCKVRMTEQRTQELKLIFELDLKEPEP